MAGIYFAFQQKTFIFVFAFRRLLMVGLLSSAIFAESVIFDNYSFGGCISQMINAFIFNVQCVIYFLRQETNNTGDAGNL